MTTDKDFKRLVRDRARKTGESYALARNRLLSKAGGTPVPPNPDELEHILAFSEDQARSIGHDFIGTEHLLLGLMTDEQWAAAEVLATYDLTPEKVRSELREIIAFSEAGTTDSPPQTPRAKKVIQYAHDEAVELGHRSVGSGHVLLGLIKEGSGVAILILNRLEVDVQQLRTMTLRKLEVNGR